MLEQFMSMASKLNVPMIYDNGLIMAIIAINMTIIGLTSLADQKCVIGIDYGRFLITKFKVAGIKMYHLIIIFAFVNIGSLFLMFFENPVLRISNFMLLIVSLIFAMYYFFKFILIENEWVQKQIHMSELLNLYYADDNKEHLNIDALVRMNPGNRTNNKLSTNVINYFNVFNGDVQKVFKEVFGPESIIYSDKKKVAKHRVNKRYQYRVSDSNPNIKDISFEFFQVFRNSEMQDKWAIDILYLLNGEPGTEYDLEASKKIRCYEHYDVLRLYNYARVIVQVDIFGYSETVFKYKFIQAMNEILFITVDKTRVNEMIEPSEIVHRRLVEESMLESLVKHFVKAIMKEKDLQVISSIQNLLDQIILKEKYKGYLSDQEVVKVFVEIATSTECKELQGIIDRSLTLYQAEGEKALDIDVKGLKDYVRKLKEEKKGLITVKLFEDSSAQENSK